MNHVIYKYDIPVGENEFEIRMIAGARILFIEMQYGLPRMWCLCDAPVDEDPRMEIRQFHVKATGEEFSIKGLKYIGSVMMAGGSLLWHYFELMIVI